MSNLILSDKDVNRIVFHYNKKHNQDTSVAPWIIKHKGQTYYIHHLDSVVGFSTKETPENEHTKGSLMFRGRLSIVEKNNEMHALIE